MEDQHIYHHHDDDKPRVAAKAEKNSRGWNLEASVSNCLTPDQTIALLKEVTDSLQRTYSMPAEREDANK